MKKRLFSYLMGIIAVFHYSACDTENKSTTTPNILFIFADDQRADALGVASNPYIKTLILMLLLRMGLALKTAM